MTRRWPLVSLGQVLSLDLDRTPIDPRRTYNMVGVLSFGRGLFHREPVSGSATSYRVFYRLKAEHIVMSQLFGWEGALSMSSEEFAEHYLSPQFPTFLCDSERLDRRFLAWFMKRPLFWQDLGTRAKGMGDRRRTLNPDALFKSQIPLPSLEEQRRIVAKLNDVSNRVAEVNRHLVSIATGSDSLSWAFLFSNRSGGPTPTPMSQLVARIQPNVKVDPSLIYHFAGVYCFGRGVFPGQRKPGSQFSYRQLSQIHKGQFVYPKLMAWEGALGIVPTECDGLFVSPEFPVFDVNTQQVLPEVLDVYFRTPAVWPELSGASTGTNVRRRRLNPTEFLSYKFPLPAMLVQLEFREIYKRLTAVRDVRAEVQGELDALMPAALECAFRSEL